MRSPAPFGDPVDVMASLDSLVLEGIDGAEPLRRCAEDYRLFASPAVRVGVNEFLRRKQRAGLLHVLKYCLVGLKIVHSGIFSGICGLISLVIDGDDYVDVVSAAGDVVIGTETGRGVDASGTAVHRDVIGVDYDRLTVKEGMLSGHVFELAAGKGKDGFIFLYAADAWFFRQVRLP